MRQMTLRQISAACKGTYVGEESNLDIEVTGITSDSRQIEKGFLFAALKGERVDGHRFVVQAYEKEAAAVLVENEPDEQYQGAYILVTSCYQALKDIAEYYRSTLSIPVIGITGSVGKTSTKEMIASVLEQKYKVWKTKGNFNNELGVPLTLFGIRETHEAAVIEMGISDFGEMHRLSKMVRPDICVMTNIGQCHLENLKTRDGILKAKSEIFDFAAPNCKACLNGEDDKLILLKERKDIDTCYFGLDDSNEIYAKDIDNQGLDGIYCTIVTPKGAFQAYIPIPGMHMVYNALAATAVGLALGLTLEEIAAGIRALKPTGGRNHIMKTDNYTVIDDCYNANPVSMKASLDVLSFAVNKKIACLGDMGELGADEVRLHEEVGAYAASKELDYIICTGKLSKYMAEAAKKIVEESGKSTKVVHYDSREALLLHIGEYTAEPATILVKASHFMGFEKVVESLTC